ncbi:hypothetical protein [Bacillus salipaludis]|uniref:Uncharacterized protein n=1 Tax=Bacillus salipaludis TaxID=2547811 RepID=A0AA90QWK9_9BACI|nr:hypothetical protein [Bacillus salipaludis]MDQ6598114.1 hypothetical protein [Bacillus salipaludis]
MKKRFAQNKNQSVDLQELEEEMNDKDPNGEEVIYNENNHRKPVFFGILLAVALGIIFSMVSGGSTSGKAEEIVGNRTSESTKAGETLFKSESNAGLTSKNFSVSIIDSSGSARMLIWDFNKEDLDQVQILVDGKPVKEKLILTNDPAAISIPVPSIITVKGLKDNGGGISYAVKFPNNRQTYFNVVTVGGSNTYTVTLKP